MEQQLSAGLGEGQIPAFVEDDEVQAGEIVGDASLAAGADSGPFRCDPCRRASRPFAAFPDLVWERPL